MRIITEDNIEHLQNLSFSKNIEKLTQIPGITTKEIVSQIRERLRETASKDSESRFQLEIPELEKEIESKEPGSPEYAPYSPVDFPIEYPPRGEFDEQGSPIYRLNSPVGPINHNSPYLEGGGPLTRRQEPVSVPKFQVGEKVFLRGGNGNPNRLWNVRDTGGGEFITIDTDDMRDFNDVGESIKVVNPYEIYRPNDIVYANNNSNMMDPNMMDPMYQQQQQQQQQYYDQPQMMNPYGMGGINVNPVIKIVNGPDNSVDLASGKKNDAVQDGMNYNSEPVQGIMIPSIEKKEVVGDIDFTKPLIVRKM